MQDIAFAVAIGAALSLAAFLAGVHAAGRRGAPVPSTRVDERLPVDGAQAAAAREALARLEAIRAAARRASAPR